MKRQRIRHTIHQKLKRPTMMMVINDEIGIWMTSSLKYLPFSRNKNHYQRSIRFNGSTNMDTSSRFVPWTVTSIHRFIFSSLGSGTRKQWSRWRHTTRRHRRVYIWRNEWRRSLGNADKWRKWWNANVQFGSNAIGEFKFLNRIRWTELILWLLENSLHHRLPATMILNWWWTNCWWHRQWLPVRFVDYCRGKKANLNFKSLTLDRIAFRLVEIDLEFRKWKQKQQSKLVSYQF